MHPERVNIYQPLNVKNRKCVMNERKDFIRAKCKWADFHDSSEIKMKIVCHADVFSSKYSQSKSLATVNSRDPTMTLFKLSALY